MSDKFWTPNALCVGYVAAGLMFFVIWLIRPPFQGSCDFYCYCDRAASIVILLGYTLGAISSYLEWLRISRQSPSEHPVAQVLITPPTDTA